MLELMLLPCGPVAQLGARMNGIHEVTGSIPVWSTNLRSGMHAKVAHYSVAMKCTSNATVGVFAYDQSYGWQAN